MLQPEDLSIFQILVASSPWQVQPILGEKVGLTDCHSFPLAYAAEDLLFKLASTLKVLPRWAVYGLDKEGVEHPDFNILEHTLARQLPITAQALLVDGVFFHLDDRDLDLMIAGVLLHDIGEAVRGDITYDLKIGSGKQALEFDEVNACVALIDSAADLNSPIRQHLKEAYLRITTSFGKEEIDALLDGNNSYNEGTNWVQLKDLFKLYERYGYLITAFQIYWPLAIKGRADQLLIAREQNLAISWNRGELESAITGGQPVSEWLKRAVLAKNVLLNQWLHIIEAAQHGIPSATHLFGNDLTSRLIDSVNNLMGLQLKTL